MLSFVSEELGNRHDLSRFDSGKPGLDRWLREFARRAAANRTGRTFVWHAGDGLVVAYYTLVAHEVAKADLPKRWDEVGPTASRRCSWPASPSTAGSMVRTSGRTYWPTSSAGSSKRA